MSETVTDKQKRVDWFAEARVGTFIHFGPYAQYERGEQVLFWEQLDQNEYADRAMAWTAPKYDPREWMRVFKESGSRYVVMTTRHHDGFCMWDTKTTNYNSMQGAAKRDFIAEYVEACREAELGVGLYYSLADWRIPAYWRGIARDPEGFAQLRAYVFEQVKELMSNYGKIDVLWFDGPWPNFAEDWGAHELVKMIRELQPDVMINPRLGEFRADAEKRGNLDHVGESASMELSDFGTSEHVMSPDGDRPWEVEETSTWWWWGWHRGEHWIDAEKLVDNMAQAVSGSGWGTAGNYLLNVGPKPDGSLPEEYTAIMAEFGRWMRLNGEAVYGTEGGAELAGSYTYGHQTVKGNNLYVILRYWDGRGKLEVPGYETKALSATLLGHDGELALKQNGKGVVVSGLPSEAPIFLPVLRIEFSERPKPCGAFRYRLWSKNAAYHATWAEKRRRGRRITDYA